MSEAGIVRGEVVALDEADGDLRPPTGNSRDIDPNQVFVEDADEEEEEMDDEVFIENNVDLDEDREAVAL